jgi:hypothetical protein
VLTSLLLLLLARLRRHQPPHRLRGVVLRVHSRRERRLPAWQRGEPRGQLLLRAVYVRAGAARVPGQQVALGQQQLQLHELRVRLPHAGAGRMCGVWRAAAAVACV